MNDGLDELIGDADLPTPQIPTAAEVLARARRVDAQASAARGSSRPVDSGSKVHPQLRVRRTKR
jgi:hypothetical protein